MPRRTGAARQDRGPPLSAILRQVADESAPGPVSINDLIEALRNRAIAALIFVFAVPNVIPLPPGVSSILGAPLLFLTAQLMLGRKPWLPRFIMRRSMERAHFAAIVRRVGPWLSRAESLLRPRLVVLAKPPIEYAVGALCFALSIILFLPIPMGNMPPAIAICMFALGLLERDGIWILGGLGMAVAAVALIWGVLLALLESGLFMLNKLLS